MHRAAHVLISFLLFVSGAHTAFGEISSSHQQYLNELKEKAKKTKLAEDVQWLRLVHYKKGLFSGWKSEEDSPAFFLSPNGKTSPEAELAATLESLFSASERTYPLPYEGKTDHQIPRCQFPARYLLIKRRLGLDEARLPEARCERFEQFKRSLAPKSASLIFSSYYLNNPSSAFGHSFLRINKGTSSAGSIDRFELLDRGINFAADVTTSNAILYALLGTVGGFKGTFSDVPYYFKVREYNDFESRDLWSYDLNLDADELEMLIAHVWEMGPSYFDYYYFSENCSYQILTTLEAASTRYSLSDHLKFFVIPADTIKVLSSAPGLVTRVEYRPSARSLFFQRLNALSNDERDALREMVVERRSASPPSRLSGDSAIRVLDTALDYMDYSSAKELIDQKSAASQWKQKLLVARASTGKPSEPPKIEAPTNDRPEMGHASSRVSLSQGYEKNVKSFTEASLRLALHDLLDRGDGYPRNAQIEFGHLRLRYLWDQKQIELNDSSLIKITSLNPIQTFNTGLSWRLDLGAKRIRDNNCERCMSGSFEIGAGYTVLPFASVPRLAAFFLLEAETAVAPGFAASKMRLGVGPAAGIWFAGSDWRAIIQGGYRRLAFSLYPDSYQANTEVRHDLSKDFAASLRFTVFQASQEGAISVQRYF